MTGWQVGDRVVVGADASTPWIADEVAALARLGYASVRVLEGGTLAWERKGLALETGKSRLLDETDDVVLKPYEKGREAMEAYLKWEVDLDPAALDAARSR